jgi:uncharacterized protein Yka (UPF0111/DUF47 family)
MQDGDSDTLEHRLVTQTATYLDQVVECVECLPPLVEQYAADEHYQSTVDRIADVESRCDRTNREISSLVADADVRDLGIRLTRVHLHSRQTIELFHLVDDVANAAEQFAEELAATAPERRPEQLELLQEMAAIAAEATDSFRRLVTAFVKVVTAPECEAVVVNEVAAIREAESDCDDLRNELVRSAFAGEGVRTPFLYRELALQLDEIVDLMEDVTDLLIRLTGNDIAIELEPDATPSA